MFYFKEGTWTPFKNKFTYTVTETTYDNADTLEGVDNLTVEPITFTEEQLMRWEVAKHVETIGQKQLMRYVLEGILPEGEFALPELEEAEAVEAERQALKAAVDVETTPATVLKNLKNLVKVWEQGSFYTPNDVVDNEGALYIVTKPHTATLPPAEDTTNYKPK